MRLWSIRRTQFREFLARHGHSRVLRQQFLARGK
jgi:hypothetical protein